MVQLYYTARKIDFAKIRDNDKIKKQAEYRRKDKRNVTKTLQAEARLFLD